MNIFKIRNINIKINIFMLAMFIFYSLCGYFIETSVMVLSILIHEIFHSIAARRYDLRINEVEIFPFGGMAKFENIRTINPKEEIFICAMGPLSNLMIMILFIAFKSLYIDSYLINYIIKVNKLMLIINILPVFPLDGGKIIRAILSLFIGYKSSTIRLVYVTYFLCTFTILYDILNGITGNSIYIVAIAVFTMVAAKKEREMAAFAFIRSITEKTNELSRKKKMKVHILVCIKTIKIKEIIECFLPNRYHIFIIIKGNGETIGTITESQLLEGIYRYGFGITLEELLIEIKKW